MAKRVKIPGRLESAETGNIVTGADAVMDDAKGKTQVVINSEVDAAIINLAQGKQDNLTFDSAPTEDSPNPVTSAGVYTADKVLSDAIEAILLLIPSAASALNKLVDMQTMNSSIATATASFKGTYNLVSDLHLGVDATHEQIGAALDALSLGADNNDYAFVQVPNNATAPTEIRKTERYKFNGENWLFEYDLNNSGFTQGQWNAINSGVTSLLVSKLSDLPTNAELTTLLAGKQDNLTFDNVPTAGSPNPVKSGGVYARNNEIVALINALDAAKQDVLTFDNAPVEGSPNPVKSGGVYTAISAVQAAIVALDAAKQNVLTFDSTPTLGSPNPVTSSGIKTELNRIDGNITTLNDLYEALTQSALVIIAPTDTWPVANPATKTIYRVVDRVNTPPQYYSDYMWNGTAMVLMATYDNAIDDVPTAGSNNLVKSGGVYDCTNKRASILFPQTYSVTKEWQEGTIDNSATTNFYIQNGKKYYIRIGNYTGTATDIRLYVPDGGFYSAVNDGSFKECTFTASGYLIIICNPSSRESATISIDIYDEDAYNMLNDVALCKSEVTKESVISITKTWSADQRWYMTDYKVTAGKKYYLKVNSYNGASDEILMMFTCGEHYEKQFRMAVGFIHPFVADYSGNLIVYCIPSDEESATLNLSIIEEKGHIIDVNNPYAYVSAQIGDDVISVGKKDKPFKTIAAALQYSGNIILVSGIYTEKITLKNIQKDVSIKVEESGKVFFYYFTRLVESETGEQAVSGYTKVYQTALADDPLTKYIYQQSTGEASLLITPDYRHPLHRNLRYRIDCVRMKRMSSIQDIEDYDGFAYYWNNGTLYYSKAATIDSSHCLFAPNEDGILIEDCHRKVTINDLIVYGGGLRVIRTDNLSLNEVSVRCVKGTAIWLSTCRNAEIIRCEGACAEGPALDNFFGDGIGIDSNKYSTHDPDVVYGSVRLIDCWCHDNINDGYSDHMGCETQIEGGLFEFNCEDHGGGITPSNGSTMIIRGAVCQYNYQDGIRYTNDGSVYYTSEPYGVLMCQNVVSKNNAENGFFIAGANSYVIMELQNCFSLDNGQYGISNPSPNAVVKTYKMSYKDNVSGETNGAVTVVI